MSQVKILVAQGGGPTAVINQSLVGVVLEARRSAQVAKVYGARHGVRGIVDEDLVDLTQETRHNLEQVARTPASALGSTRDKPDLAYCRRILATLQAHGIGHFLYIGGNDSSDTVRIVAEEAAKAGHPLRCIHIPKTIDNDLMGNDHTPGYPSAARFVAQAFAGANLDNAALPGVYLGVVMGRHAGFLTAAAALARRFPDDGPHLVYLPERAFSMERFLADVKTVYARHGRCVIAVSEGIHDEAGATIAEKLAKNVERAGARELHGGARRARQRAALGHRRAGRPAVRRDQGAAGHQARARRHLRLPAALVPRLRLRGRPARGARGRRTRRAVRAAGRPRRLGGHPPQRRLRGRHRAAAAGSRRRQDPHDGRRLHRRDRQRRDPGVLRLPAAAAGGGHAAGGEAAGAGGGEGLEEGLRLTARLKSICTPDTHGAMIRRPPKAPLMRYPVVIEPRPEASADWSDDAIGRVIFALLQARAANSSICPSEVARALAPDETQWRALMPQVRRVAAELVGRRRLRVTSRGMEADALTARGPIRLSRGSEG